MDTTVAANAPLDRNVERALLVTAKGFCYALKIGCRSGSRILARHIVKPDMLFDGVMSPSAYGPTAPSRRRRPRSPLPRLAPRCEAPKLPAPV